MLHAIKIGIWTIAFALLVLPGCGAANPDSETDSFLADILRAYPELRGKSGETATVSRVVDGDTLELDNGARVRLIGVNTPETHGRTEYFGAEASAYTKSALSGQSVVMFKDVSETDRYGRLLRYVFRQGDAEMFNEKLVRDGYANAAAYPPDVLFAERFTALEREARERSAGLWQEPEPVQASCGQPQIKGNINSRGEKIYHMPDGAYYEVTIAEAMFCTEEEAKAAGFRRSQK